MHNFSIYKATTGGGISSFYVVDDTWEEARVFNFLQSLGVDRFVGLERVGPVAVVLSDFGIFSGANFNSVITSSRNNSMQVSQT